jgi:hypothetical protein
VTRQVRLDDDVIGALDAIVERTGASLSGAANAQLRRALNMVPKNSTVPPSLTSGAASLHAPDTRRGCRHPVGRRIGNHCAACGTQLKVR